jgi:ATP-dependent Zn protease
MNATVKTILVWVLILVSAVTLWNLVEQNKNHAAQLNLTELLALADAGKIEKATITPATGMVVGTETGGKAFKSTIPPGYDAIYSRLERVPKLTIEPPDSNPWLALLVTSLLPMLVSFGFGWQCARWSRQRPLQPPMTTA